MAARTRNRSGLRCAALLIAVLLGGTSSLAAQDGGEQDNLLQILRRNFAVGSLDVKIQVIEDAARMERGGFGPLYATAINYVLDNATLWLTDTRFTRIGPTVVQQIGAEAYAPSQYDMWRLFQVADEPALQIDIANAWIAIAEGGGEIDVPMVAEIDRWLARRNAEFRGGQLPRVPVLTAVIDALGAFGQPSSFVPLFSALFAGYTDEVVAHAEAALAKSGGPLAEQLQNIMAQAAFEDRLNAYRMALSADTVTDDERGALSEQALALGVGIVTRDLVEKAIAREMRFLAVRELVALSWARAAPLAIDNFNLVLDELDRGIVGRERLLEAISLMAIVGTRDAAARLGQYLMLTNALVEGGGAYDATVVVALLEALGALGDNIVADDLIYASYLDYNDDVKRAARRAFDNLKF